MKLVHGTTNIQRVISILRLGIVRPKDLCLRQNFHFSDDNHIYLTGIAMENIRAERMWGSFQFVLNDWYVKTNRKQFRVHARNYEGKIWKEITCEERKKFHKFVEEIGFKKHHGKDLMVSRQIISTEPINPDGLESLVIPRLLFQEKEESRIIRALPKHMHLYVSAEDKVARIK